MQAQVLNRVHTEIERQVQAVDEALRQLEDEFIFHLETQQQQQAELFATWKWARDQWDQHLVVLDQVSLSACHATDEATEHNHADNTAIQDKVDAFSKLKTQHYEMQHVEQQMTAARPDKEWQPFVEHLRKLRQQRVQRPQILCSHGVSSRTGQGLQALQHALAALMEDRRLFAHVGANVPLHYLMLERLTQEGRAQASYGAEHDSREIEAERADWEQVVTKHVTERASARLRAVCGQGCVSLNALEEAADEVGMDKDDVHSALLFLHATGSVLHYGIDMRRGNHALQGTVFMQPQIIIDAMKYVIREPSGSDINDEVCALDVRIRQDAGNGDALDRFLGTHEIHGSGVLTRQLLRHLWRHLNPQHHTVLLELMKAFRLLRQLLDTETFLVPAMLSRRALPVEYVTPDWWRPSKAAAVAVVHENETHRAEMRIKYKVLGGRLPFGFFSELQVHLCSKRVFESSRGAALCSRIYRCRPGLWVGAV